MKNKIEFLLICSFVFLLSLSVYPQQALQDSYRQGLEELKNLKYDAAIVSLTDALKINPELTDAYLQRAKARENNQRDLSGAMSDVQKALELNPSFGEAYYERAVIRYAQLVKPVDNKELSEDETQLIFNNMLNDLDSAVSSGYKTKDAYLRRADLKCHDLNKCAESVADFDAAILLAPDDLIIYTSRANAKRRMGDVTGAVADLSEVVNRYSIKQSESKNNQSGESRFSNRQSLDVGAVAMALTNLGGVLGSTGDRDRQLNAYNQALTIFPGYFPAYEARGQYKMNFGDLDDAIGDFNKSMEITNGRNGFAYVLRGTALQLQGKEAEAQKDFEQAVQLSPHLKDQIESMVESAKASRTKNGVKSL